MFWVLAFFALFSSSVFAHHSSSSVEHGWKPPAWQLLEDCLPQLTTHSVDVIVDIAFTRNNQPNANTWNPAKPNPLASDVAYFVESIGRFIPTDNFYAVIVDNETRYYLNMPSNAQPVTTVPPQPARGHHHGKMPEIPTIRTVLRQFFTFRAMGNVQNVPTSKPSTANPTIFSIVMTDGTKQTPLSAYPDPDSSVIIDLGGNFSINNKNYLTRNVLLAPRPSALEDLEPTVLLQICQAIGGYKSDQ